MEDSDTLGIGESDDINLPLDEIIQRKAHRQRRPSRRGPRRGTPWRRYPRPSGEGQDYQGGYGQEGFPMEVQQVAAWQPYDEQTMQTQMAMQEGHYYQMYAPPPPQMEQQPYRTRPPRGAVRGGVRKPVLDRRRGFGRQQGTGRTMEPHLPMMQPPPPEEEKCTILFENGCATIRFSDIDIVKVNADGDVELTTAGNQDGRFLKAMNDVLALINMEILGDTSKGAGWKIKEGYSLVRYYDGIVMKGKGMTTRGRAQTIHKAFDQPNPKALEATLASNLAARRLGLNLDQMGPGNSGVHGGSSIYIRQDQQLTQRSNYSISFVDQHNDFTEEGLSGDQGPGYNPYGLGDGMA